MSSIISFGKLRCLLGLHSFRPILMVDPGLPMGERMSICSRCPQQKPGW